MQSELENRLCNQCQKIKPIEQFVKSQRGKNGRRYCCKECCNQKQKEDRKKNKNSNITEKICNQCNKKLDVSKFTKNNAMSSGYLNTCKECTNNRINQRNHNIAKNLPKQKTCKKCNELKDGCEFYRINAKDGYKDICKECCKQEKVNNLKCYTKTCTMCKECKNITNFSFIHTRKEGLNNRCNDCRKLVAKKLYLKNKEQHKNWGLKRLYNITIEEYYALCKKQDNKCYICKEEKDLAIDHSHKTGDIRKLLCEDCNMGLGLFDENVLTIHRAIEYLIKYENM